VRYVHSCDNPYGSDEVMINETEQQKPHLSPSSIEQYLRCPTQYMYSKVIGVRVPPTASQIKGRAIHKGAETNFRHKLETKENLPIKDVLEAAADEFERGAADVELEENEDIGQIKDTTIKLTKLYYDELGTKIQPVLVEQKIVIDIPGSNYCMVGFIDLVDDQGNILDIKTRSRTPSQQEVDKDFQLTVYSWLYRNFTGNAEAGVGLDCVVEKKAPEIVRISSKRTDADINRMLNVSRMVIHAIESAVFVPNHTNMMCSPKACKFWDVCHRDF